MRGLYWVSDRPDLFCVASNGEGWNITKEDIFEELEEYWNIGYSGWNVRKVDLKKYTLALPLDILE